MWIKNRKVYVEQTEDGADESSGATETPAPKASDFLKADLSKARKELRELKARYEGFDPDEYAALKADREEREQRDAEAKGNFEKLLANERKKSQDAEVKYKAALAKSHEALADAALVSAFTANGGLPEHLDNFKTLAKAKLERNDDGEYVVPESFVNDKGEQVTEFADFVAIARDKAGLGFAFAPLNKSQGSNSTGGKDVPVNAVRTVTPAEAGWYIKEIAGGELIVE